MNTTWDAMVVALTSDADALPHPRAKTIVREARTHLRQASPLVRAGLWIALMLLDLTSLARSGRRFRHQDVTRQRAFLADLSDRTWLPLLPDLVRLCSYLSEFARCELDVAEHART